MFPRPGVDRESIKQKYLSSNPPAKPPASEIPSTSNFERYSQSDGVRNENMNISNSYSSAQSPPAAVSGMHAIQPAADLAGGQNYLSSQQITNELSQQYPPTTYNDDVDGIAIPQPSSPTPIIATTATTVETAVESNSSLTSIVATETNSHQSSTLPSTPKLHPTTPLLNAKESVIATAFLESHNFLGVPALNSVSTRSVSMAANVESSYDVGFTKKNLVLYPCIICQRKFKDQHKLRMHIAFSKMHQRNMQRKNEGTLHRSIEQRIVCSICNRKFQSPDDLQLHLTRSALHLKNKQKTKNLLIDDVGETQ